MTAETTLLDNTAINASIFQHGTYKLFISLFASGEPEVVDSCNWVKSGVCICMCVHCAHMCVCLYSERVFSPQSYTFLIHIPNKCSPSRTNRHLKDGKENNQNSHQLCATILHVDHEGLWHKTNLICCGINFGVLIWR